MMADAQNVARDFRSFLRKWRWNWLSQRGHAKTIINLPVYEYAEEEEEARAIIIWRKDYSKGVIWNEAEG